MAAGDYLVLAWTPHPGSVAQATALARRLLHEGGWRLAGETERSGLWVREDAAPPVHALPEGGGFLVGDAFPAAEKAAALQAVSRELGRSAQPAARRLAAALWGRYVAVLHCPADGSTSVYRDPCGDLDALTWGLSEGVSVVASDIPVLPAWLRPPRASLDWDRIAAFVGASPVVRSDLPFDGVTAVPPGFLQAAGGAGDPQPVWRPADFVGKDGPTGAEAEAELRRGVDSCTAALVGDRRRLFLELSGGLDSAILAGTLAKLGLADRVCRWLNYAADRAESDERAYARAVTDRLGVELTVVEKPLEPLGEASFAEVAQGVRPALHAVDAPRDRDTAARIRSAGVEAVLSGQGGDAVFFQMPSVMIVEDTLRRLGPGAVASPLVLEVARRTRKSVWQVLWEARRGARQGKAVPSMVSPLVTPEVRRSLMDLRHPWMASGMLPPAKQLQVQAIANGHLYRGDCRKRRAADLVYPLLSQPLVELCLSIRAAELAGGEQDRRLARAAFADRLPAMVRERRAKGELGAYYGRLASASLPFLRPYLLEGCLADAGVLDRTALDAALDPNALIQAPETGAILTAAAVEAWVRHWQGRLPDAEGAPRGRANG